jgi:AbrB family looped-hinge helix DNA binding protein
MAVTLSPKFQIVIPKEARKSLKLKAGIKFEVIPLDGQLILVPLRPIKELKGSMVGIDTSHIREKKDREI